MKRHFVIFKSPGTFVAETSEKPVNSWDVDDAKTMARSITGYGKPYGFYFVTRSRGDEDLDSKITATSPMYYLGGKVETLSEVKARSLDSERTLLSNMECNKWHRIVRTLSGWTQPLNPEDVVLDWPT